MYRTFEALRRPAFGIGILTAGLILGIMTLPFISAITRDVFETVPRAEGSRLWAWRHHLGSTAKCRAALCRSGVVGGVMLALGRALGETMAVTFVIGNAHRIATSLLRRGPRFRRPSPTNSPKPSAIFMRHLDRARPHPLLVTASVLAAAQYMLYRLELRAEAAREQQLYLRRRIRSAVFLGLSVMATIFGLGWLASFWAR